MRVNRLSTVRLAAVLFVMTIASSSFLTAAQPRANNHDTSLHPSHIQQHVHNRQHYCQHHQHPATATCLHNHTQYPHLSKRAPSPPKAWADYYTKEGIFLDQDTLVSGTCHSIPSSWGILELTAATRPNTGERDVLTFYNDKNCVTVNKEPATQTGKVIIAMYFDKVPQSVQWTRIPSDSTITTTKPSSQSSSTLSATPTVSTSSSLPPSTITSISPSPDDSEPTPPPHSTVFPTALIPPKPHSDSSSSARDEKCSGSNNPGCKGPRTLLIIGIVIAVVVITLMAAGSVYVYRRFYTPDIIPMTGASSSYRSNRNNPNSSHRSHPGGNTSYAFSGTNNMNSTASYTQSQSQTLSRSQYHASTTSGTGRQPGDDANPDYEYCHDDDDGPDDGSKPPRFMFDHSHDNIDTNRNPRLFNESRSTPSPISTQFANNNLGSSDINLVERVRG
ncbi:hypothetical protein FBU30_000346 [Linnemannia zychae]|nr:hypothetical protein FBU30_000346 [Linnemannia zychae]